MQRFYVELELRIITTHSFTELVNFKLDTAYVGILKWKK